jgi:F0F1-type ATP synthase assembly protein I
VVRVHDPIAAGRRSALRAVAVQGLAVALLAAAFLARDVREALAVGVGGLALVLGNALAACMALGGIVPARVAFGRLLLGTMAKWLVAIAVLAAALVIWRLPPLPMLLGLAAGLLAYLLALNFLTAKRKRQGLNA